MRRVHRIDPSPDRPKREPEPTVLVDVEQVRIDGRIELRLLDNYGRITTMRPPCSRCHFAILGRSHRGVECRAGVTKVCDTRIMDSVDPVEHGWPGEEARMPSHNEILLGHHGDHITTLSMWGSFSLPTLSIEELIIRHASVCDDPDLAAYHAIQELRNSMKVTADIEDQITDAVRFLMVSDDVMNIPEMRVYDGLARILEGLSYDDEPAQPAPIRNFSVEKENFSPPHRHYRVAVKNIYAPDIEGASRSGWIRTTTLLGELELPRTEFVPHPNEGSVHLSGRAFALSNDIICPLARAGIRTVRDASYYAIRKSVSRDIASGIARVLGASLRLRAVKSGLVISKSMLDAIKEL